VVLSYALLGPELTLAYVAFGLVAPIAAGLFTEHLSGPRRATWLARQLDACCAAPAPARDVGCCGPATAASAGSAPKATRLAQRLLRGTHWALFTLGPSLGFYIGIGVLLAAALTTFVPSQWIVNHLGAAAPFGSLLLVALFGASIYVCAVAHIPLVAALLAAGAAPGAAIVFLVTGAVSNLPEFIALQKILGLRTVLAYVCSLVLLSIGAGWAVNLWLLPGFNPVSDPLRSMQWFEIGSAMTPIIPQSISVGSTLVVLGLIAWGVVNWLGRTRQAIRTAWSQRQVAAQD
jgi:hypothetical protein